MKQIAQIFFAFFLSLQLTGQDGWDWKDPNDFGFVDLGDSKLLGYNLGGLGIRMLLEKENEFVKHSVREFNLSVLKEYRREPLSTMSLAEFRYGVHLRKWISLGGGNRLYSVFTDGETDFGLSGFVWFQWHLFQKEKWKLSYDNGVGPNYFFQPFPNGGTRFNFTTHYGLALDVLIVDQWWSIKFVNYHISNADIKGRDRNPALDAIGIQIGVSF